MAERLVGTFSSADVGQVNRVDANLTLTEPIDFSKSLYVARVWMRGSKEKKELLDGTVTWARVALVWIVLEVGS